MKMRPKIVEGDLVRLSKKGKMRLVEWPLPRNCQMIVTEIISGDGIDRESIIRCTLGYDIFDLSRNYLWKTGFNVLENETPNEIILDQDAPLNNNGRDICYLCHMPTKQITALIDVYHLCKNPNCKWYEN